VAITVLMERIKLKKYTKLAYGFRDIEFFELKILALHEINYALLS